MITECTRFCVTMPHKMERRLKKIDRKVSWEQMM